jgi:hypothetical protein
MDEKERRIVEGRLRLRDRFKQEMASTPSVADARPLGSGPKNRHGMPSVPVGRLLVHTVNEAPLEVEHGGPVRVITPQLYACGREAPQQHSANREGENRLRAQAQVVPAQPRASARAERRASHGSGPRERRAGRGRSTVHLRAAHCSWMVHDDG